MAKVQRTRLFIIHHPYFMNIKDVYIVIPAKDEASKIGLVVKKVKNEGFNNIIVVNDGSEDNTASIATAEGATVISHLINLGPGAATQTGMDYAVCRGAKVVVTIDGDNQHYPSDIWKLIKAMNEEEVDVVIGSRFLENDKGIPKHRLLFNKIGNWVTALFTGLLVTDSQSGLKAMRINFVEKANLQLNGYEFCTEIISLIRKHGVSYTEVPIQVKYTQESMAKGQNFFNGVQMIGTFVRYFL